MIRFAAVIVNNMYIICKVIPFNFLVMVGQFRQIKISDRVSNAKNRISFIKKGSKNILAYI